MIGIEVLLPDGVKAKSKIMALSSHFDLPARAGVLEQVPYIGHDSCCFCDEHGETVKTGPRGHVMTFPFRNTATGHCKLRTAEEVTANSNEALERNTVVSKLLFYLKNYNYHMCFELYFCYFFYKLLITNVCIYLYTGIYFYIFNLGPIYTCI